MQVSCGKKVTMISLIIASTSLASGSDLDKPIPIRLDPLPQKVDCISAQPISSAVGNTNTGDQSIRTGNRSYSANSSNTLNRASATPIPASVTISNSCEQSRVPSPDSATSAALTVAVLNLVDKVEKEQNRDSGDIWKALEKFAPVFQTLIWALLIICLARRFARPIIRLLLRLGARVEKLHIKTPFGEVFADIRPQSEDRQKFHAAEGGIPKSGSSEAPGNKSTSLGFPEFSELMRSRAGVMKMYYEAEDFVIRTLQQEFGTSIAQNVQTGTGIEMDGFFTSQNIPHVIEVKLVHSSTSVSNLSGTLVRLLTRMKQEKRFENARVILALVYIEELSQVRQRNFETELFRIDPAMQIRWFSLLELRRRFMDLPGEGDRP